MEDVYIHPGVTVQEDQNDDILDAVQDYLNELFSAPKFLYLFLFQLLVFLFVCWCFYRNMEVVSLATLQLHPSLSVFYIIVAIACFIPSFVTYRCMLQGEYSNHSWYALLIYDLFLILWCTTVLFERWDRGTGLVMATLFVLSSVWYLSVTYYCEKSYVAICLLLVFLTLYMLYYAYNVR